MLFLMYFSILGPGKHLAPECIHLEANQLLVQVTGVVAKETETEPAVQTSERVVDTKPPDCAN